MPEPCKRQSNQPFRTEIKPRPKANTRDNTGHLYSKLKHWNWNTTKIIIEHVNGWNVFMWIATEDIRSARGVCENPWHAGEDLGETGRIAHFFIAKCLIFSSASFPGLWISYSHPTPTTTSGPSSLTFPINENNKQTMNKNCVYITTYVLLQKWSLDKEEMPLKQQQQAKEEVQSMGRWQL